LTGDAQAEDEACEPGSGAEFTDNVDVFGRTLPLRRNTLADRLIRV